MQFGAGRKAQNVGNPGVAVPRGASGGEVETPWELTYLLYDTFTDSDGTQIGAHTMDVGPGWTRLEGLAANQTISSNAAQCVTDSPGTIVADAGVADLDVRCRIKYSAGDAVGIVVRCTDANNHWLIDIGNAVIIYEKNGGGFTNRASAGGLVADAWNEVLITCSGTTIAMYVDDELYLSYSSATFNQTATKVGLRFGGAASSTRYADTFEAAEVLNKLTHLTDNPNAGAIDECVTRLYLGGKAYWSSHREDNPDPDGYEYTNSGTTPTEIQALAGKAMWLSVYDAALHRLYAVGEAYDSGEAMYHAAVTAINTTDDTIASSVMLNESGKVTDDINEFIAVLDDGANLVVGEGGVITEGGDFENSGGLWTLPKATIGTISTFTRVHEELPFVSGYNSWNYLTKYGSTYLGIMINQSGGKYVILSSTNLTNWATEVDGSALALNDIRPAMLYHSARGVVYAAVSDGSRNVNLKRYNGSWTTWDLGIAITATNLQFLCLAEYGDDLILFVSQFTSGTFSIYRITALGSTPTATLLVSGRDGGINQQPFPVNGTDMYFATCYPGALWKLTLV